MKITVDLTPTGLENWQEVTTTIFKYISLLRSSPPSSEVFNEIKAIAEISFKFAEKTKNGRYATALSNWMQRPLPREKIVSGGGLLEDFRPDEVAAVLQLLDPRRATVGITTRELPKDVDGSFDRNEPIYGTEYTQRPIPERILKEVSQPQGGEGWN
jgi:insulysin